MNRVKKLEDIKRLLVITKNRAKNGKKKDIDASIKEIESFLKRSTKFEKYVDVVANSCIVIVVVMFFIAKFIPENVTFGIISLAGFISFFGGFIPLCYFEESILKKENLYNDELCKFIMKS